MRNYRVLYRRGDNGEPFKTGHLGRNHYVANGPSDALQEHLLHVGAVARPYQFLVQDTQSLMTYMFEIPAVVTFKPC
jgi:hypothetical protein